VEQQNFGLRNTYPEIVSRDDLRGRQPKVRVPYLCTDAKLCARTTHNEVLTNARRLSLHLTPKITNKPSAADVVTALSTAIVMKL
jgi:hypothetical protein